MAVKKQKAGQSGSLLFKKNFYIFQIVKIAKSIFYMTGNPTRKKFPPGVMIQTNSSTINPTIFSATCSGFTLYRPSSTSCLILPTFSDRSAGL